MMLPMPKIAVVSFLSLLVINLVEAEEEETCKKGEPGCASDHQHDKYSKEANVDKFDNHVTAKKKKNSALPPEPFFSTNI